MAFWIIALAFAWSLCAHDVRQQQRHQQQRDLDDARAQDRHDELLDALDADDDDDKYEWDGRLD